MIWKVRIYLWRVIAACTALVSLHSTHFKREKKEKIFVQLKRVFFFPNSAYWPVLLCIIFSVVLYYFGVWRFVILIFSKKNSCSCYLNFFFLAVKALPSPILPQPRWWSLSCFITLLLILKKANWCIRLPRSFSRAWPIRESYIPASNCIFFSFVIIFTCRFFVSVTIAFSASCRWFVFRSEFYLFFFFLSFTGLLFLKLNHRFSLVGSIAVSKIS